VPFDLALLVPARRCYKEHRSARQRCCCEAAFSLHSREKSNHLVPPAWSVSCHTWAPVPFWPGCLYKVIFFPCTSQPVCRP
jgi:hypothetical protein